MKPLLSLSGIIAFWLTWPLTYVYMHNTRRTRVLVVAGQQALLIRNWHSGNQRWSLPGGGIKRGESLVRAATRELMEETHVALGIDQLQPLGKRRLQEKGLAYSAELFIAELSQPIKATPKLPEVIAAEWITLGDLDMEMLGTDVRVALSLRDSLLQ